MTDDDRIEGLERIPMRRAPARDLWPGIEARITQPERRRGWLPLALAASVVAGLAGLLTVGVVTRGPGGARGDALQAHLDPAETEYLGGTRGLPLTTDSRAIVEANLGLMRAAEREVRQALEQDPDSPTLRSLLASTENRQRALRALL